MDWWICQNIAPLSLAAAESESTGGPNREQCASAKCVMYWFLIELWARRHNFVLIVYQAGGTCLKSATYLLCLLNLCWNWSCLAKLVFSTTRVDEVGLLVDVTPWRIALDSLYLCIVTVWFKSNFEGTHTLKPKEDIEDDIHIPYKIGSNEKVLNVNNCRLPALGRLSLTFMLGHLYVRQTPDYLGHLWKQALIFDAPIAINFIVSLWKWWFST